MLAYLIIAHLIGDFILQNRWMQRKDQSWFVCMIHVLVYAIPMGLMCLALQVPIWFLLLVLAQHFLQDRFALHKKWMVFYKQSPDSEWPGGAMYVDQTFHMAFIGILSLVLIKSSI